MVTVWFTCAASFSINDINATAEEDDSAERAKMFLLEQNLKASMELLKDSRASRDASQHLKAAPAPQQNTGSTSVTTATTAGSTPPVLAPVTHDDLAKLYKAIRRVEQKLDSQKRQSGE